MLSVVCLFRAVNNISPAYGERCFKRVDMFPLSSSCFKITSVTILNTVADIGSPCNLTVIMHKTSCGGSRKHRLHPAVFQLLRSSTNSCVTLLEFLHNANRSVVGLQSTVYRSRNGSYGLRKRTSSPPITWKTDHNKKINRKKPDLYGMVYYLKDEGLTAGQHTHSVLQPKVGEVCDAHIANYTLYNRFLYNMICCYNTYVITLARNDETP